MQERSRWGLWFLVGPGSTLVHFLMEKSREPALPAMMTLVRSTLVRSTLVRSTLVRSTLVRSTLVRSTLVRSTLVRSTSGLVPSGMRQRLGLGLSFQG
jgi:hypothetical protein